jgi:hypothetical protein
MMSATIKRKHLVLTGLVIALGTAMFVNWYYTKPEAKSVSKAADETTTVSANLGDAMYVNGTAAAAIGFRRRSLRERLHTTKPNRRLRM